LRALRALLMVPVALILAACTRASFVVANLPALATERVAAVAFGEGPREKLDFYPVPAVTGEAPRPLVVFFYGGNFTAGRREDYRFVGSALSGLGYATAIPDYRLYPEVRFPAFLDDAARAVVASQRMAAARGADPRRVLLAGHSAGAYIAAMLALEPRYLREAGGDPLEIIGWVGLSGPYDIAPNSDALRDVFDSHSTPDSYRPLRRAVQPSSPALLLHGADDDVVGTFHSERLARRLRELGVDVSLHIYPGRRHADTVASLSAPARGRTDALARISAFFAARDAATRAAASSPSSAASLSPSKATSSSR
jgi:acetyl esterase/lipase